MPGPHSSSKASSIFPNRSDSRDCSQSEDEGSEDYRKGGYHAVRIGDNFKRGRYEIQRKLGWGNFSTVWLAWDHVETRFVALKVLKSAWRCTDSAVYEINILKQIAAEDPDNSQGAVKLLDHFKHTGPNGEHVCIIFEFLGDNLLELIKLYKYNGLPLRMVKQLSSEILKGLDFLHRLSIIHTDLKPENIVLESPLDPQKGPRNVDLTGSIVNSGGRSGISASALEGGYNGAAASLTKSQKKKLKKKLRRARAKKAQLLEDRVHLRCKIVDLGNACWRSDQCTSKIQTREYRCPEVILGAKYGQSADMWSFACIVFQLATGDVLFNPESDDHFHKDQDHLAQMIELLGLMPREIALGGRFSRDYFNQHGE